MKLESSKFLNNKFGAQDPLESRKKVGQGLSVYRTLASEKRLSLVKLVIKGLFLILFHAWDNDLASKL